MLEQIELGVIQEGNKSRLYYREYIANNQQQTTVNQKWWEREHATPLLNNMPHAIIQTNSINWV